MKFLKAILAVTVVYCLVEGLDATGKCQYCDLEVSCDPTQTINCGSTPTSYRCVTAKILDNGVVKHTKSCKLQHFCNQTADLCGIPDRDAANQTCLAAGCCDTDVCEAKLTSLLTPASTTYVANAMPTATTRDVMSTTRDVIPTPTPTTTQLVLPETRATVEIVMSSADISPTTTMPSSSSSSSSSSRAVKDTVPTGVETTMEYKSKWMSESVSSMPVVETPGTSAQTKGPGAFNSQILVEHSTRPTCGDSAGMRHVVSPLALLTVSLLVLVF